ncbi:Uncharacterized protein Fot_28243 [Forsythia ovata]|uniref:Uncharacterized protein n=1 Tax=Forsythia ovata TaxID=205694 RepID=A0ABD1TNE8_9LAMI
MASSRNASKSKRRSRKRRNHSATKRNRCQNKATTKPVKKKYNIPMPEGENVSFGDVILYQPLHAIDYVQNVFYSELCDEFAKSIADGLNEVSRLRAVKKSPRSKMASSYKKSYAANMKVHPIFKGMGRLKFLQKLGFVDAYPGSIALKEIAMMTELRRVSIKS